MRVKLSRNQFEAVELLLRVLLNDNKPTNVAERLVYDIVFKIYQKIRLKVESLSQPRSGWSLGLTDQEAMAYYVFYATVEVDDQAYKYEAITMQNIFNEIDHMNYGRSTTANYNNRELASGASPRRLGSPAR